MRLDFNVLWVEDQPNAVNAQSQRIDSKIRQHGFRLRCIMVPSIDEAAKHLSSEIYGDHIDLVLMDYDLGKGPKGDQGLAVVREHLRFKDIIFYSSQAAALTKLVANQNIQGVYCSTRDDLPDTAFGLFEMLEKKVLDIDHSRGIIMGATSDIDQLVNDCIVSLFDACDESGKESAKGIISQRMVEIRKRFDSDAASVESIMHISELFEKHNVYTSMDRIKLLRKMLAARGESYNDSCDAIKDYFTVTIPKRNMLAHVRVTRNGFSRKLFDKKGNELTSEEMKELRASLLKNQEIFENLSEALKAPQASSDI